MPAAATKDSQVSTGHGCTATTTILDGDESVMIGGKMAAVQGSNLTTHTAPAGDKCLPHATKVTEGSSKVEVNGKPLARVNDGVSCSGAGKITSGESTVVVG
jgi:uncharacterized Zn-binding protein involved in type VI secretion|tara:strand:+ start:990 stop:1295 length:306 start_codon:yes stop_codon:yes gene_type:complete